VAGLKKLPADAQAKADRAEAVRQTVIKGTAGERRAVAIIAGGDVKGGLQLLTELASKAASANGAQWRRIGRITYAVDTARALAAYEKVAALDRSNPWDAIYLGRLYERAGALAKAKGTYENALAGLAKSEIRNRSILLSAIADVAVAQGNLADALQNYQDVLAIAERLAKADPTNASRQRDLSVSHNKVGDVQKAQGNLAGALQSYRAARAIRQGRSQQCGLATGPLGVP
jgi:tetratricopeptide (TPR) repeat protein